MPINELVIASVKAANVEAAHCVYVVACRYAVEDVDRSCGYAV